MTKPLERSIAVRFTLVSLITIALGLATLRSMDAMSNDSSRVVQTYRVLEHLGRAHARMHQAESSARGFFLTGKPQFLEEFERVLPDIESDLGVLDRMIADHPDQRRRLGELRPMVARRIELLGRGIRIRREGGYEALQAARTGEGPPLMAKIGAMIRLIVVEEQSLLGRWSLAAQSSRTWTLSILSLGIVANGTILSLVFRQVARESKYRGRTEGRLEAQHAAMAILAESRSLREAMPRLLRAIGEHLRVDVAEYWALDAASGRLRLDDHWPKSPRMAAVFAAPSTSWSFGRGEGLPGRIWASGGAAWIEDLSRDPEFLRASIAAEAGLRHGFGFPIAKESGIVGVVTLLARRRQPADGESLRVLAGLGAQIGQFVERREREAALRESEARFRTLADGAPIMIWMGDAEGNRGWFSQGWLDFAGRPMAEELGRGWAERVHPDDLGWLLEAHGKVGRADGMAEVEYRLRRADGGYRWIVERWGPTPGRGGRVRRLHRLVPRRHGDPPGPRGRRGRQPGQERVPGQHEPRDPHADERHHRHDRACCPGH